LRPYPLAVSALTPRGDGERAGLFAIGTRIGATGFGAGARSNSA